MITFLAAAVVLGYAKRESIGGIVGEMTGPGKDTSSIEFKRRQAIREYNDLLGRSDTSEPIENVCIPCLTNEKGKRRKKRHDLIRAAQNHAAQEHDKDKQKAIKETIDRFTKDMERVEDAKLCQYTYTANEVPENQPAFLRELKTQPPPGFKNVDLDQVAEEFGVDKDELSAILDNKDDPTQKIMIFERDKDVLGQPPKYTVAMRGSTSDSRDWNNNGKNEIGVKAPHQENAVRLGRLLRDSANAKGQSIDKLVSVTGHSKGGSEAQAFAAGAGSSARVFNPAGFDPKQYGIAPSVSNNMRIDRTIVVARDSDGNEIKLKTDPLHYAQEHGVTQYVMKKPVTTGAPRELEYIDPNLSVPSVEQSKTEAHSMLQVIEGLERDKISDQTALERYVKSPDRTAK
ncbi:MAG: DUF2974 domain-containing protein [Methylocystaceae bacterium]|nr:DUF2974 domain-containing protein [Methylocystaceae bacterium]